MRSFVKKSYQAEIDLTPMMDIVFIMLIFFIVTATFVRENGLELNQPPDNQARVVNPDESAILIQVNEAGVYSLNGAPVLKASIKPRVAQMLAEKPGRMVVIMPDYNAPTGLAIGLYDTVLQIDRNANVAIAE